MKHLLWPMKYVLNKNFFFDRFFLSNFLFCSFHHQVTKSLRAKIQLLLATFPLLSERPCSKITSSSQCYPSHIVSVLLFLLIIITCLVLAINICRKYNVTITELDWFIKWSKLVIWASIISHKLPDSLDSLKDHYLLTRMMK